MIKSMKRLTPALFACLICHKYCTVILLGPCILSARTAVFEIPFGRLYNEQVASMKSLAQTSVMPGCGIAARMISCEWSCL